MWLGAGALLIMQGEPQAGRQEPWSAGVGQGLERAVQLPVMNRQPVQDRRAFPHHHTLPHNAPLSSSFTLLANRTVSPPLASVAQGPTPRRFLLGVQLALSSGTLRSVGVPPCVGACWLAQT